MDKKAQANVVPRPYPIFDDSRGEMSHSGEFKIGRSMESLVEMIQIENHYEIMWILPSETGFLELLNHENP